MFRKPFVWLCRFLRIRILHSRFPDRIGHLALEPVCFVKEGFLGLRKPCLGIFPVTASEAANPILLKVLKRCRRRGLVVSTHRFLNRWLESLADADPALRIDMSAYSVGRGETAAFHEIERQWQPSGEGPVLRLTDAERERGRQQLAAELGVPRDAWFVCFHSRSPGFSTGDDRLHDYRNSPIETYLPAMEAVVAAGGWVIRMGDSSMTPLPKMKNAVDYAVSDFKSPFLDIYLCSDCRFFLGNTSGLVFVAAGFGRPTALTNLIPVSGYPDSGSIGIPKRIFSESLDRELTLTEIMATEVANYRLSYDYELAGLRVIDNQADEIRELVLEMLAADSGEPLERTEQDEALQARALALLRPGHYACGTDGRFGRDFLRRHRRFFEEPGDPEHFKTHLMKTKKENQANALAALERKEAKIKELRKRIRELEARVRELENPEAKAPDRSE